MPDNNRGHVNQATATDENDNLWNGTDDSLLVHMTERSRSSEMFMCHSEDLESE